MNGEANQPSQITKKKRRLRKALKLLLYGILVLLCYVLLVVAVNRFSVAPANISYSKQDSTGNGLPALELEVLSWNLGYAGLGRDANFIADGGTDYLPNSKRVVIELSLIHI